MFEEINEYNRKVLGERNYETIRSLKNLAQVYRDLREYDKAEPLFKKSFRLSRELLGENHPNTLDTLTKIGWMYRMRSQYTRAQPMFEEGYQVAPLAGSGMYVLVIKVNGVWTVSDFAGLWVS